MEEKSLTKIILRKLQRNAGVNRFSHQASFYLVYNNNNYAKYLLCIIDLNGAAGCL